MAHMLGLSVNSYGKIERNQVVLKPQRLREIAAIFNVAPSYIINIQRILEQIKYTPQEHFAEGCDSCPERLKPTNY